MKIILRENVSGLGRRGQVVSVSDGYARNYLIPKGFALRSQPGAEQQASEMRRAAEQRDARERAAAEEIARKLAPMVVRLSARASGERLFGSVTAAEIVDAVYDQTGLELERKQLDLTENAVKTTGLHMVPARLHEDVQVFIQLEVEGA
ncbi:MAG: 50S ribosomal protein L9 [Acidimicrobiia bacterium]|nr:50S ribosomal protein L9 [Acidimicrobiia bacterium]